LTLLRFEDGVNRRGLSHWLGVGRRLQIGWVPVAAAVALVAFAARLVPVLRGGGLYGLGNYDDGVNFSAALGLGHGLLPYRDFLFLHPPGTVVALLPFAELSELVGDSNAMAAARVAWMLIGAGNAVLVARILWPAGRWAGAFAGLFYAVFFPAVYMEHSTLLEGVASSCLLAAMLLLSLRPPTPSAASGLVLAAGGLLGYSASVKIWGVVVVAAVVLWCFAARGARQAVLLLLGAGAGVTAVCLPFFAAAPAAMWRMVVMDQLGRPRSTVSAPSRLVDIAGLRSVKPITGLWPVLLVVVLVGAAALMLAWSSEVGRLAGVVLVAVLILLMSTPSWFLHYSGLAAAPLAVVAGAAAAALSDRARRGWVRATIALLLCAGLVAGSVPDVTARFGRPFPGTELAVSVPSSGCVTSDDPATLIQLDVLSRNIQLGCPFVVDLGGYSYDLESPGGHVPRNQNTRWQRLAINYLRSGRVVITTRFSRKAGFDAASARTVKGWQTIGRVGRYSLRVPTPASAGSNR
jgi:lipoprotein signal peptidase